MIISFLQERHSRRAALACSETPVAFLVAFLATLLAAPVQAAVDDFPIPATPLSSSTTTPPNVLLIMDDSGSMAEIAILRQTSSFTIKTPPDRAGTEIHMRMPGLHQLPLFNALAYNPAVTYRPWMGADGKEWPDMNPGATSDHPDLANKTTEVVNLWEMGTKFYAPKNGFTNDRDFTQYTLYKLISRDRAEACTTAEKNERGYWISPASEYWPEGRCQPITHFQWSTQDGGIITRSLSEEWRNYANWYGYYRTRMKATKAAVTHAFAQLDENHRVGYRSFTKELDIPVMSGGGLFKDGPNASVRNRSQWFHYVHNETSTTATPLRTALNSAGEYFMRRDSAGPWGPEKDVAKQMACRQNFVILATDGEWNDGTPSGINNEDGSAGEIIRSPTGESYQYKPERPYRDDYAGTLADVAMKYWKQDLRTDMPNVVPTSPQNPAFWQHLVTFTISIGMRGNLDPVKDWPALVAGRERWPDPMNGYSRNKIDDLFHASVNGHGTYVSAMDPQELSHGLEAALGAINERTASASSLALDSSTLEAGGRSFVASYLPGPWSGDLKAYTVTSTGVSSTLVWSAAKGIPAHDQRRLYTHAAPGQPGMRLTTAFPTSEQQTALTVDVAAWIRGDRSREGTTLRTRKSLLGDIVHSSPVHVKTAGVEAVFVAANDGMLHVFDATDGKELLAYVPGLLDMALLKELSRVERFRHRYFVDGPLTVARTDGGDGVTAVGTLGRGGRGVYGLSLNLAQPNQPPSSWEFIDDSGMGQVLSRPQLVRLGAGSGAPDAVLVPNGINSPDGKAMLYVLDASTGKLRSRIAAGDETGNGLSTPTVLDMDGDGRADTAYAGDLRGNVWRFNLKGAGSATRVLTATDANGNRQPITGGVGVAFHPATRQPWVFFGTGSYLTAADAVNLSTQSWYGVEDGASGATRSQLLMRKITVSGTADGEPVRAFEKAQTNDMRGKRGWVVDLRTPGVDPEGERMIGESQQIIGGRVLLAASIIPTGGGCGGNGRGYLNAIDPFTGGATSHPFFDVNGDSQFDGQDEVNGTPVGSIDLDLGMISDPAILLGKLVGGDGAPSQACVGGASGTIGCAAINPGSPVGRYGRVSWVERITEP